MKNLLSLQQSRFFWIGLLILLTTSLLFYLITPLLGIDHTAISFKQFIYHSFWRILTSGFFLFLLLRFFDKRFELKRKMLDETFQRYDALSKATNDAIWDFDMATGKVYYNPRVSEIFGYSASELNDNRNWWGNHIHPDDQARVKDRIGNCLSGQTDTWQDEYRFGCADGSWKIVYDRSFIIRDQNGKPIRMIGAMKDITDLRQMEKDLHEKQLQEKNLYGQRIIHANEAERKKIRDDLHEDVNQILASIKMHMAGSIINEDMKLSSSMGHLDSAISKIRKISNTLSSFTFDLMGLSVAIQELIDTDYADSDVAIIFHDHEFDTEKLNKESALLLYRITENMLSLFVSHKDAELAELEIKDVRDKTSLTFSLQYSGEEAVDPKNDLLVMEELKSKLEMYEGKINITHPANNNYIVEILI